MRTLALTTALLTAAAPGAARAERPMNENPRTIAVSGDAELKVAPDEVSIQLGVESLDKDLSKAKRENDERIKKIIAAAKSAGVDEKRIATDQVSIEPHYSSGSWSYGGGRPGVDGYSVRRSLVITLRDLSRFDAVLSATVEAGANYVHGVNFATTELRKHRDKARELAMKAAEEKATLLAQASGAKRGRVRSISEGGGGWWSGYGYWGNRGGGMMSQNISQNVGGAAPPEGTMAPGLISVSASVSVVYELD